MRLVSEEQEEFVLPQAAEEQETTEADGRRTAEALYTPDTPQSAPVEPLTVSHQDLMIT